MVADTIKAVAARTQLQIEPTGYEGRLAFGTLTYVWEYNQRKHRLEVTPYTMTIRTAIEARRHG